MYGFINPQLPATQTVYRLAFDDLITDHLKFSSLPRLIESDNLNVINEVARIVYETADRLNWIKTDNGQYTLEVEMDGEDTFVGATLKC
jgi:hypothetical protein